MNTIPDYEIQWLRGIDNIHKTPTLNGLQYVYPVSLLPPTLKKFVKSQNLFIDYINLGPQLGCTDGMIWSIWGWKSQPNESYQKNIDWTSQLKSQSDPPTLQDLQTKIKSIQNDINQLSELLTRYKGDCVITI